VSFPYIHVYAFGQVLKGVVRNCRDTRESCMCNDRRWDSEVRMSQKTETPFQELQLASKYCII